MPDGKREDRRVRRMRRMSWRNVASSKWRFKSGKRGGVAPSSGCGIAGFWMSNLVSILHQVENMDMRRAHKLALILGVLLGLFGPTLPVAAHDRKSVVAGKKVTERVDIGG